MTRTVQLWSYREANRASYVANSDIVEGWVWYAHLDNTVCMSCVEMHGTEHTLDEVLDDHHNGRCVALPLVKGMPNPIEQSGEEWFLEQPENVQQQMMGMGKYEAWQEGKFQLADIPGQRPDEVYGQMRGERSLKELLGGEQL